MLKGQFTRSDIYPSRLFSCECPHFGDIGHRNACLLLNVMELKGKQPVVPEAPNDTFKKLNNLAGHH